MAFITETAEWAEGIYQYEQDDVVEGGPDGIDNIQAKALAARTNYLKDLLENLQNDKQTQDPTLTAIAALATAADKFIYFTGEDQAAIGTVTAFARSLLAGADAAAVRAMLSAVSQAELNAAIAGLVNSSPATLDTLKELADALGDDPNFATTMTNALAARVQTADLQKGTHVTATAGGTADAITAAYTPAITTDTAGRIPEVTLSFKATAANTAAGATFNAGTGAFGFIKGASTAIVSGDIPGAGAIMQVRGRRGSSAAEDKWVLLNPATGVAVQAGASIVGASKNLVVKNNVATPASKIDLTADEIVLKNASGSPLLASAVSLTADITVNGANGLDTGAAASNTWYYLWAISNGYATELLLSTSPTAPTMPGGYTYKALISAVYRTTTFRNFIQNGNHIQSAEQWLVLSGGTATAITQVSASAFVPPIHKKITVFFGGSTPSSVGQHNFNVYSNSSGAKLMATVSPYSGGSVQSGYNNVTFIPEVTQTYFYSVSSGSASHWITGFEI